MEMCDIVDEYYPLKKRKLSKKDETKASKKSTQKSIKKPTEKQTKTPTNKTLKAPKKNTNAKSKKSKVLNEKSKSPCKQKTSQGYDILTDSTISKQMGSNSLLSSSPKKKSPYDGVAFVPSPQKGSQYGATFDHLLEVVTQKLYDDDDNEDNIDEEDRYAGESSSTYVEHITVEVCISFETDLLSELLNISVTKDEFNPYCSISHF